MDYKKNNHNLIVQSLVPISLSNVDSIWGFIDRERIYKNISLLCPEIMYHTMRYISERRNVARVKPGDVLRENDLITAASTFSVTRAYNYNTGRIVDFAQYIDAGLNVYFYREMINGVFYQTLFDRIRLLIKGDRKSLSELDEKYYNIQRVQFSNHVIRGEYEKWQYIQSLLYFGYLLRIHFFACQILRELKVEVYPNEGKIELIKEKAEQLYNQKDEEYKSNLIADEFVMVKEYIGYMLIKSNGLDYYKKWCERCGVFFYRDIAEKLSHSSYAIGHLYGYVEENYIYEGKLDQLKTSFTDEQCTFIVFGILNNVLLDYGSSNIWATQLVYCEPYVRSYWKYFHETKIVDYSEREENLSQNTDIKKTSNYTVPDNKRDVTEKERKRDNLEKTNSNGKESVRENSSRRGTKVPESIENMKIDGDLFDFLSKNVK